MPDFLDRLKTALTDRYAIQKELGAGGMATVSDFMNTSRRLPLFAGLIFAAACGDLSDSGTEPEPEGEPDLGVVGTLAASQQVVEEMIAWLRGNSAVQSLAALGDAFTFAGGALPDAVSRTFVYNPLLATYEPDDTRGDAPPNAARFILYTVDPGLNQVALPLEEIGYVDLIERSPPMDSALTIRAVVNGGTVLDYEAHGFGGARPCFSVTVCTGLFGSEDSSRIGAVGSLSTAGGQLSFDLVQIRRPFTGHSWPWQFDYTLAAPGHGDVRLTFYRERLFSDLSEEYALRIAFIDNGNDSTVVEALLHRDDRFGISGEIKINSTKRLTLLEGATFVDLSGAEVASDTLIAFHGFLNAVAHETIHVVNAPLEPAAFAFRTAPPLMPELEIVTTTTGTNLDPDGYTLTLDDSTTQAIEATETVVFSLPLGPHSIELQGVAANCTVQGYNPRNTDVLRGTATTVVSLDVSCGPSDVRIGQIAFEADGEIYVINADGSGQTNLTNNPLPDFNPRWSPDGSRIAFLRLRRIIGDGHDSLDIYVVDADGGGVTRITERAMIADGLWGRPDWSPDGARLVFRQTEATPGRGEIYVMNADGSGVVQLTDNGQNNYGPTWSPDGSRIAYLRVDPSVSPWAPQIHVMNADGSGNVQITNDPNEGSFGPVWSPNGGRIAFNTGRRIFLVNPDGSDLVSLTNTEGRYGLPAWSPDGSRIASEVYRGYTGSSDIYIVNVDGSGVTMFSSSGNSNAPTWSPDGLRIAYENYIGPPTGGEVWVMDAGGSWFTRLTHGSRPIWRR